MNVLNLIFRFYFNFPWSKVFLQESHIDRVYMAMNSWEDGQLGYYGVTGSVIQYRDNQWTLRAGDGNTTALSRAAKISFVLGTRLWRVEEDAAECGREYEVLLTLSGCGEDEFTCGDGQCVGLEDRCDLVQDCRDGADERDCRVVVQGPGYDKELAPFTARGKEIVPVSVDFFMNIQGMDQGSGGLEVRMSTRLEWSDHRLHLHDLRPGLNVVPAREVTLLWLPEVSYGGRPGGGRTVGVRREGASVRGGLERRHEVEIFQGGENTLVLEEELEGRLRCGGSMMMYPFDKQVIVKLGVKISSRGEGQFYVNKFTFFLDIFKYTLDFSSPTKMSVHR